ncbi:MAG: FIG01224662: hypothetical protein, partial [uncultured Sphingomonadaceae bacterium]
GYAVEASRRRGDVRRNERIRGLLEGDATLHTPLARRGARPARRDAPLVARPDRGREHPRAEPCLRPARSYPPPCPRRQRAGRGRAVHGAARHLVRVRSRPGPARQLRRLPLPLRAAGRRGRPAVAPRRVLRRRRLAAPPPRPSPRASPIDQRRRRHRARLVQPGTELLPGMGGEGRRDGGAL